MTVTTRKLDSQSIHQVDKFNRKFTVNSKLVLGMEDGRLTYWVAPVTPYEKEIPVDEVDASTFIDSDEKVIFFADVDGQLAGQVKVISWWNGFTYIDDLIVNPEFRGLGVGQALMREAIEWSKTKRFPGIMLETQDDNVPACQLYQKCGYVLGGFDQYTLKNFKPNETALFWYLIF
ncbi:MAG TPA: GNAT family N-acetyltransferase [Anaerolineales bacterium]|nr:GNAT family N-acetyltransferase [Anaerolineales bacterium]